jgi:hypothetical protein
LVKYPATRVSSVEASLAVGVAERNGAGEVGKVSWEGGTAWGGPRRRGVSQEDMLLNDGEKKRSNKQEADGGKK